jgi:hypothetical protein
VFAVVGFCFIAGAAFVCGACGQSAVSAPQPPPRDIETRIVPPRRQREIPRLIAPPPAYGNKVVMAQGEPKASVN